MDIHKTASNRTAMTLACALAYIAVFSELISSGAVVKGGLEYLVIGTACSGCG